MIYMVLVHMLRLIKTLESNFNSGRPWLTGKETKFNENPSSQTAFLDGLRQFQANGH